jgi:hypothetical protein
VSDNKQKRRYSVTDDAGYEEHQERAKIIRDQRINDLRKILSTVEGRRWVYSIIERCHVFHPVMTGNSYTFFNDGMRQVGLMVIDEVAGVDKDLFGKLFAESFDWNKKIESILHGEEEADDV